MTVDLQLIARVCHEANRGYCQALGDMAQPTWELAPEWQRRSALAGVELHWFELMDGHEPMSWKSHEAWLKEKLANGWKYGAVKDAAKKEHPCMVPYEQLPPEQKAKDYIFVAIVKSFFEARLG